MRRLLPLLCVTSILLIAFAVVARMTSGDSNNEARVAVDAELVEVNECLAAYKVTMYRDGAGKHRIWGDINRIQDIYFGPCRAKFPTGASRDLDEFFATEVDFRVVECLRAKGVQAEIDLSTGAGIELKGDPPEAVVTKCLEDVYEYYSRPPEERAES